MTQKLIWNKIWRKRRSLSLYRDGYWVDRRCLSREDSTLIGYAGNGVTGVSFLWCCHHLEMVLDGCNSCLISIGINGTIKIQFLQWVLVLQKMNFILLISESCRLLWNKFWIDTIISWEQYLFPLIIGGFCCNWYQSVPE